MLLKLSMMFSNLNWKINLFKFKLKLYWIYLKLKLWWFVIPARRRVERICRNF